MTCDDIDILTGVCVNSCAGSGRLRRVKGQSKGLAGGHCCDSTNRIVAEEQTRQRDGEKQSDVDITLQIAAKMF